MEQDDHEEATEPAAARSPTTKISVLLNSLFDDEEEEEADQAVREPHPLADGREDQGEEDRDVIMLD